MAKKRYSELAAPKDESANSLTCSYVSNGEACRYPGTISHETNGEGRWLCSLHYDAAMGSAYASQIVTASRSYAHPTRQTTEGEFDAKVRAWIAAKGLHSTPDKVREMAGKLVSKMAGGIRRE